jgi:hypothetical protein
MPRTPALLLWLPASSAEPADTGLAVYGATSSGIAAAVHTLERGARIPGFITDRSSVSRRLPPPP